MTSISSAWRRAMVRAGEPSSQRKRLGAANQTWPVATNGCVSVRKVRVWTKSAVQVCRFVWEESQPLRTALVSAAKLVPQCARASVSENPRACLKTPALRRVRARGLQETAETAMRCRPGAPTGRGFKQALNLNLALNLDRLRRVGLRLRSGSRPAIEARS